jgi:hypothetical protein
MRIWIECPVRTVTQGLLDEYTDIFARLIIDTYPMLEKVYRDETYR